jgi:histidine triad (HIT) family protein
MITPITNRLNNECIFCRIRDREMDSQIILENEFIFAINDINPRAEKHLLIISRDHIEKIDSLSSSQISVVSEMVIAAKKLAHDLAITQSGYRLTINNGPDANMTVAHLHMHLLGGQQLGKEG